LRWYGGLRLGPRNSAHRARRALKRDRATIEYFKSGTLRPVPVTTTVRSELLPEVPTVREFVPGFEASYWADVGAPRNTPVEIIQRLNKEINASLADPKLRARFAELGGAVLSSSPADRSGRLIEGR
jgi:tripartite-type tricarboxylate transporter receptor subunit TctC